MMTEEQKREVLAMLNPECLLMDEYHEALIGFTCPSTGEVVGIYDKGKIIEILMRQMPCNREDAEDYYYYNVAGSIQNRQEYPIILERFVEE